MKLKRLIGLGFAMALLILCGCTGNCKSENPEGCNSPAEVSADTISIFLENSGSMKGYLQAGSEFQAFLSGFMVEVGNSNFFPESVMQSFFIGQESDGKIGVDTMPPKLFRDNIQNAKLEFSKSSFLDKMIGYLLKENSDNEISFFVSDCILSKSREETNRDPEINKKSRSQMKDELYAALLAQPTPAKEIAIIALESKFKGKYYSYQNKPLVIDNDQRPYYLVCIGEGGRLNNFLSQWSASPSYQEQVKDVAYFGERESEQWAFKQKGRRSDVCITNRCGLEPSTIICQASTSQFVVAVPGTLFGKGKIQPTDFQVVSGRPQTQVKIVEIKEDFDNGNKKDQRLQAENGSGLYFTIEVDELDEEDTIKLIHKSNLAGWAAKRSNDDDRIPDEKTTFAFDYFVGAFANAFYRKDVSTQVDWEIDINIKPKN